MSFSQFILEPEQKNLFIRIVEEVKKIPRYERMVMVYSQHTTGGDLTILSKNSGYYEIEEIIDGDLDELSRNGLLRVNYSKRGSKKYLVSPEGFQYYEWLMKEMGKPVERIEKHSFNYFDSGDFRKTYKEAYDKLKQAEELLWSSDSDANFSAIGHHCRESMQEFADTLYEQVIGKPSEEPKASIVKRIRAVIEAKSSENGKTVTAFLESLLPFWGTVSDLVQRQEHAKQKEGEPINWEDARRVVFQTANVMFEMHRTIGK